MEDKQQAYNDFVIQNGLTKDVKDLNEAYTKVNNNPIVNTVSLINSKDKFKPNDILFNDNKIFIEYTDGKTTIKLELKSDNRLEASTQSLFRLSQILFTNKKGTIDTKREFSLTLKDYKKFLGISNLSEARRIVKDDILTLRSMHITAEANNENKELDALKVLNIFEEFDFSRGIIKISYTPKFATLMAKSPIMTYPIKLLAIKNKYAKAIGEKITALSKLNLYDNNNKRIKDSFCISVKTLLDVLYINGIPTPEEIRAEAKATGKKPRIAQTILYTFEKALKTLEEENIIDWDFSKEKCENVNYDDLCPKNEVFNNPKFEIFEKLYIRITFKDNYKREGYNNIKAEKRAKAIAKAKANADKKKNKKG